MSKGVHFVRSVSQRFDYREDHRGIPLRIIIFMAIARAGAFYLVLLPPMLVSVNLGYSEVAIALFWVVSVFYGISTNNFLDVFTPLGFHMFRWTITKRGGV